MLKRAFDRLLLIGVFVGFFLLLYVLTGSDLNSMFDFIWGLVSGFGSILATLAASLLTWVGELAS